MDWMLILQLVVLLAAIALGARSGGIGMGLWGGVGLFVLVFVLLLLSVLWMFVSLCRKITFPRKSSMVL